MRALALIAELAHRENEEWHTRVTIAVAALDVLPGIPVGRIQA
jgi:hypothetical protein